MSTKLNRILKKRGWKVSDLHKKIEQAGDKVPYYALTQMANGKRTNYNVLTLKKICKALDVTPNDIVEDEVSVFDRKSKASKKKSTKKPSETSKNRIQEGEVQKSQEKEEDFDLGF